MTHPSSPTPPSSSLQKSGAPRSLIGELVDHWAEKQGISQTTFVALMTEVPIDRSYLSRIVRGERTPSVEVIREFHRVTGIPLAKLALAVYDIDFDAVIFNARLDMIEGVNRVIEILMGEERPYERRQEMQSVQANSHAHTILVQSDPPSSNMQRMREFTEEEISSPAIGRSLPARDQASGRSESEEASEDSDRLS